MNEPRTQPRVKVTKNGPYLVSGGIPLARQTIVTDAAGESQAWQQGEAIATAETYALCRCGQSANKPFCDGTHQKIGFDGRETASRAPYAEQARVREGPAVALSDARALCAGARFCDPNTTVWKQVARSGEPQVREMFIRQVNHCPSGRLTAAALPAGEPVEHALPVSIGLVQDPAEGVSGPLWLRGGIPLIAADGFAYEVRNRVTLCRCGQSQNKPFCDGSHIAAGFSDSA